MKKYSFYEEKDDKDKEIVKKEVELEDKDYFLIKSIDNLSNEIQKLRVSNG